MYDEEFTPEMRQQNVVKAFEEIASSDDYRVDCRGLELTLEEFSELADILKNKRFTKIDLSLNRMNKNYMESLQKIIMNNAELEEISLEANQIDDEAITKLLDKKEVRQNLSNVYVRFAINPYSEKGLLEAAKYMSISTIAMMTSIPRVKDEALVSNIIDAVEKYSREEDKGGIPFNLPFNLFLFKQLEEKAQVDKLQNLSLEDELKDPTPKFKK